MTLDVAFRELIAALVREEVERALAKAEAPAAPQYLSTAQVAEYTGLAVDTLEQWRRKADGPPHVRVGRRVLYDRAGVDAWLAANERRPRPRR